MKIEQIEIESLTPWAQNSRTHSDEQITQIVKSIDEFGFTNPVLIDKENWIIAGHGRVMAAKQKGMKDVPCLRLVNLSETQKKAYVIADNQLALNAGWDLDVLTDEIAELKSIDFELDLLGFSDEYLSGLFTDEVEMPELKSGDRDPFQQMTFTLHDEQVDQVKAACNVAKGMGDFDSQNENSNGNALARVCETFLTHYDNS